MTRAANGRPGRDPLHRAAAVNGAICRALQLSSVVQIQHSGSLFLCIEESFLNTEANLQCTVLYPDTLTRGPKHERLLLEADQSPPSALFAGDVLLTCSSTTDYLLNDNKLRIYTL